MDEIELFNEEDDTIFNRGIKKWYDDIVIETNDTRRDKRNIDAIMSYLKQIEGDEVESIILILKGKRFELESKLEELSDGLELYHMCQGVRTVKMKSKDVEFLLAFLRKIQIRKKLLSEKVKELNMIMESFTCIISKAFEELESVLKTELLNNDGNNIDDI